MQIKGGNSLAVGLQGQSENCMLDIQRHNAMFETTLLLQVSLVGILFIRTSTARFLQVPTFFVFINFFLY